MLNQLMNKMTLSRMGRCIMCVYSSVCQRISCSGFWGWMYPLHGGGETTSEAALGVLILWFCWWAHAHITHTYIHTCMHVCIPMHTHTHILFRRLTSIIHTPCLTLLTCVRIYTFCYVGLHLTVALQRVCKVSSLLLFVFFFSALISILPCLKVSFLYSL